MGQIEHYLYRVAPLAQGGYISVHKLKEFTKRNGEPGKAFPGRACSNWKQAIWIAEYYRSKEHDVYMSQGGQAKCGITVNGTYYPNGADRNGPNIWCLKSLRMDVDAKLYASLEAMDTAVETFYSETSIPKASFAVKSGSGGYHLYWTFDRLVTPEEWQPLADALAKAAQSAGLNFDSECTVDRTRVLRIPGTRNYKDRNHPTEVEIYYDTGGNFTYEELQQALAQWVKPLTAGSYHAADGEFEDERNMQDGRTYAPVDIQLVIQECGHIANTLSNHGRDCGYHLWLLNLGFSCHTTDPSAVAHDLSSGYSKGGEISYSETETTEKLKALQAERQRNKSLGPPKCATFERHGAKECATCKHRDRGSNPISIAYGRNGHAYTGFTNVVSDLPNGYFRGPRSGPPNKFIYTQRAEGGDVCVFRHEIIPNSGRVEGGKLYTLVFVTKEGKDEKEIRIVTGLLSNLSKAGEEFGNQGVPCNYVKQTKDFFMAWVDKLRNNVINIPPLGWHVKNNTYGFAFNGKLYTPTAEYPTKTLGTDLKYGVMGSDQPERDIIAVILNDNRPDLWCILAAAFAAPLIPFTGHNGVLIGGVSTNTGVGKTTAMSASQAVWGSTSAMNGLDDTYSHIIDKLATLKNLPAYQDEIKDTKQEEQFLTMVTTLTQGRSKGRADMTGAARPIKEWELPIIYAANRSMLTAAEQRGGGTLAIMVRMFEFECPTYHTTSDNINRLRHALKSNYGHIGAQYAAYLGHNRLNIDLSVTTIENRFKSQLGYSDDGQRFWFAAAAALTAGSYWANQAGLAPFNYTKIYSYLIEQLQNLRSRKLGSSTDYTNPHVIMSELSAFIKYHWATRTVITKIMVLTSGRPPKVEVENNYPTKRWEGLCVQISRGIDGDPTRPHLRFADSALTAWCKATGREKSALVTAIQNMFAAKVANARIGSGTGLGLPMITELCWTICIQGTDLAKALEEGWGPKDDDATDDSD